MDGQLLACDNSILCGREHMNLGGSLTISTSVPLLGWLCYLSILSIPSSPHPPSLSGSFLVLHVSSLEILYSSHMNEERFTYIGLFWTCGLYVSLLYDLFINVQYNMTLFLIFICLPGISSQNIRFLLLLNSEGWTPQLQEDFHAYLVAPTELSFLLSFSSYYFLTLYRDQSSPNSSNSHASHAYYTTLYCVSDINSFALISQIIVKEFP